jgi:hypothetical protein
MGSIPDCLGAAKNQLGDEIVTVPGGLGMLSYQFLYTKNEIISKVSCSFILCQTTCIFSFSSISVACKFHYRGRILRRNLVKSLKSFPPCYS